MQTSPRYHIGLSDLDNFEGSKAFDAVDRMDQYFAAPDTIKGIGVANRQLTGSDHTIRWLTAANQVTCWMLIW